MQKREVHKEKIRYILQFFLNKGENASQMAEMSNGVYGIERDTVTQTHANVPDNSRCDGYDREQHRLVYFSNDICTLRNGCAEGNKS
ncbi:hypothetical protein TNCV_3151831 [Trichonephila clavipes]|nr:hypothetical protein TNCV_3151831 [Trichonephila clavipes]